MLVAYFFSSVTAVVGILLIALTRVFSDWHDADYTTGVFFVGIVLTMVGLCSFGLTRGIDEGFAVILKRIDSTKASSASDQAEQSVQGE